MFSVGTWLCGLGWFWLWLDKFGHEVCMFSLKVGPEFLCLMQGILSLDIRFLVCIKVETG